MNRGMVRTHTEPLWRLTPNGARCLVERKHRYRRRNREEKRRNSDIPQVFLYRTQEWYVIIAVKDVVITAMGLVVRWIDKRAIDV